jgi:hypothetical protein
MRSSQSSTDVSKSSATVPIKIDNKEYHKNIPSLNKNYADQKTTVLITNSCLNESCNGNWVCATQILPRLLVICRDPKHEIS